MLLHHTVNGVIEHMRDLTFGFHKSVVLLRKQHPMATLFLAFLEERPGHDTGCLNFMLQATNLIRMSTVGLEYRDTETSHDTHHDLCTLRTRWVNGRMMAEFGGKAVQDCDKRVKEVSHAISATEQALRMRIHGMSLEGWDARSKHEFRKIGFGEYLETLVACYIDWQPTRFKVFFIASNTHQTLAVLHTPYTQTKGGGEAVGSGAQDATEKGRGARARGDL